jgi:hypothetical protein
MLKIRGGAMHEAQMWIVPLIAILVGLLVYFTSKDPKWPLIGSYIFLCGFFIVLWLLTFRGPLVR